MSIELRTQIVKLLSDIPGEMDPDDEEKIINTAYKKLSSSNRNINEETIIDAILASFQDDDSFSYLEDPYEDELFDLLRVSSYGEATIREALSSFEREAASEYDMHRGSIGSYYDEKGKDYRPADEKKGKGKMEEFEIKDGIGGHDEIKYHLDATKTDKSHRSKADMLVRS